jgi:hypothetical protein
MTSLTAPWDRASETSRVVRSTTPLSDAETQAAVETLQFGSFPAYERGYKDPIYENQVYCLHSFVPSKGATPDSEGVFGFMKCRGTFFNIQEANDRAEFLVRNVDSYHDIQTSYVGRPFPVCKDTKKFVKETVEVDIKTKAVKTISDDIKQKKADEKKMISDIKEREERLLEQTRPDYEEPPLETYTTLQVKKANLVFTYVETQKKLREMRKKIQEAYREIRAFDEKHPECKEEYFDNYMQARKAAHIPDEHITNNFTRYLLEDADLDFDRYGDDQKEQEHDQKDQED